MSKITERVAAMAQPVVEEEGCSLWDVEYVREAGTWYLRVYIDKEGGVDIDDCERFVQTVQDCRIHKLNDSEVFIYKHTLGEDRVLVLDPYEEKVSEDQVKFELE